MVAATVNQDLLLKLTAQKIVLNYKWQNLISKLNGELGLAR